MIVAEEELKCRMAILLLITKKNQSTQICKIALIGSVLHTTIPTKYQFNTTLFSAIIKIQKL